MTRKRGTRRRAALPPSPMAFTLDGSTIANVTLVDGADDAHSAIREAVALGGRVFVGVELRDAEVTEIGRWLHDAAYEGLAFILGERRQKPRRRKHKAPRNA